MRSAAFSFRSTLHMHKGLRGKKKKKSDSVREKWNETRTFLHPFEIVLLAQ
jgi:hypothetical protein